MNKDLLKIIRKWHGCTRCNLHQRAHTYVWYRGDCPCDVLFIGEAPGKDEDLVGEPFIGRAGDLLDEWIKETTEERMGSYSYGITNIVRCIPLLPSLERKIRVPTKEEAKACRPILIETVEAANPKLIILLGRTAQEHYNPPPHLASIPVEPIIHPAAILRSGGIGSSAYHSGLVRLIDALEKHLYAPSPKKAFRKKSSRSKAK